MRPLIPAIQEALIDSSGRLIGVNTAIISRSGSSAGIGFAVPVDVVNQVVPELIAKENILDPELESLSSMRNQPPVSVWSVW